MFVSTAYVLSTRPLSATLIADAAAKGVIIDVLPFIGTELLRDDALTRQLRELSHRSLTAVFTSANAVGALEHLQGFADWKIFCLSGATRVAVTHRFGEDAVAGTAASAKELAEVIIRKGPAGVITFFCGDRRRDELPQMLKAAGLSVHELIVYRTILTPARIEKHYDAIAFFSPTAVESFFSVNTVGPDIPLFAIGTTTAAALNQKCSNPVLISSSPDEKLLIDQIIKNSQH